MIIEAKPLSKRNFVRLFRFLKFIFRFKFNKIIIRECEIRPDISYLLLCNHFSFWDGFWLAYMVHIVFQRRNLLNTVYTMTLKQQMLNYKWLRNVGCFSIEPGKISVVESIQYATKVMDTPGNILFIFPQGKLESSHVRTIEMEKGIASLIPRIKAPYQMIWCSNITEYFESINQTLYMNLLDLGPEKKFDFEELKGRVNTFHQECLDALVRNKK